MQTDEKGCVEKQQEIKAVQTDDGPCTWENLSQKEKGRLLLAHHEGMRIQVWSRSRAKWEDVAPPRWFDDRAYRVKLMANNDNEDEDEDAEDAARFRWLLENHTDAVAQIVDPTVRHPSADAAASARAAIDAAMKEVAE